MKIPKRIKNYLDENNIDEQQIDWNSYSNDIDLETWLENEYGIIIPKATTIIDLKNEEEKKIRDERGRFMELRPKNEFNCWDRLIPELRTIFVTADLGEGKTAYCYYLCDKLKRKMPVYVFKHPNSELMKERGYRIMQEIDEIENLSNAVLWLDEPQLTLPKYEKRGSIILILSTSDTRYITSAEDFYISTYIIKKIDYPMIKRGSKVKQIVNDMATITAEGYSDTIRQDEYILFNKRLKEINGKYTFELPKYFDDKHSKPFR